MSDKNFSRRRKGPMRFRPTGGIGSPKAAQARAEATGNDIPDEVFDVGKHHKEIEQAENIAAGLPADEKITPVQEKEYKRDYREPRLETPAEVHEDDDSDTFEPVHVADSRPECIVATIRAAANRVVRKVQRLITPTHRIHKEVIINAESLETRVAVLEDGKLEEFTIERTSDERLVGSIFKGKVKNLEDGLKAAFVDIGFEKNAFLHRSEEHTSELQSPCNI